MREYDIALKLKNVLRRSSGRLLTELTGLEVARWHNVELAEVQVRIADLLGETAGGRLVHIERQSTNDPEMAPRMLEYAAAVRRQFGCYPLQVVLYVGTAPMRMSSTIEEEGVSFRCRLIDVRELDGERLLASDCLEDNVIAILAKAEDVGSTVRRVLGRIAASDPAGRERALAELSILAGLRKLEPVISREVGRMPILDDIMDHELFGPKIRQGRVEGERTLVLRLMEKRFGPLEARLRERIESMDVGAVEDLGLRLLDAKNLRDLLN